MSSCLASPLAGTDRTQTVSSEIEGMSHTFSFLLLASRLAACRNAAVGTAVYSLDHCMDRIDISCSVMNSLRWYGFPLLCAWNIVTFLQDEAQLLARQEELNQVLENLRIDPKIRTNLELQLRLVKKESKLVAQQNRKWQSNMPKYADYFTDSPNLKDRYRVEAEKTE